MFFMQAPVAKQVAKDPLPLIRGRMRKMARKEEKVQQWEKKRTDARRRSEKNARGRASSQARRTRIGEKQNP